jgi:very-short-patch-repair endonuclease
VQPRIAALFAQQPAVAVRDHPSLRTALWRLRRSGELASPLPGILIRADDATPFTRLATACMWAGPRGVVHGRTAAEVWTANPLTAPILIAHPSLRSRAGVAVSRHLVPPEFVVEQGCVRLAAPAYVAAELAGTDRGRLLSEFLRTGMAAQGIVQQALGTWADSPGQAGRRRALRDCERNPWSFAEVRLHGILREGRVTGWTANGTIRLAGQVFHPDVLFEDERLVLEFDGRSAHTSTEQFVRDRERQNLLVVAGYTVLRFTWEHLDDPGYVLSMVRRTRNELRQQREFGR